MSDDWPAAGTLLAFRYRLVSRLETGGMAEVWHARDELLARPVALKTPTGSRARTDVLQLAWREARMGARLSHPNIAAVHDYDEAVRPDGSLAPFVVMELLAGETVAARLARAPLPWREAAGIGAAVAGALTAAHASGVVHRDVKPGNVMLTPTGVKILDFGISAVTGEPDNDETGATFGTPAYVAPERLDGRPAEPATDVYGLGVLLFEMVTGQPPYPVDTWEELAQARANGATVLPCTLPMAFRELVTRCLAEEPDRRPTAAEAATDLAALTTTGTTTPAPPATTPRAGDGPGELPITSRAGDGLGELSVTTRVGDGPGELPITSRAGSGSGELLVATRAGSGTREMPIASRVGGNGEAPVVTRAAGGRLVAAAATPAGAGPAHLDTAGGDAGERPATGHRRVALLSSLVAVVVSLVALFAALGSSRQAVEAEPAPAVALPPASPLLSAPAASPPPVTAPAAPPPATTRAPVTATTEPAAATTKPAPAARTTAPVVPSAPAGPAAPIGVDDALARFRSAVEAGRSAGQIRADVATDLINMLGSLGTAEPREARDRMTQLRGKLRDRVEEGSVDDARAEELRDRLTDLDQALTTT